MQWPDGQVANRDELVNARQVSAAGKAQFERALVLLKGYVQHCLLVLTDFAKAHLHGDHPAFLVGVDGGYSRC